MNNNLKDDKPTFTINKILCNEYTQDNKLILNNFYNSELNKIIYLPWNNIINFVLKKIKIRE
jgi:hypothetical protein